MNLARQKQLLAEIKAGNKEAFSEVYQYFYPKLLRFALYKVSDKELGLDIVANTFLKALDNISKIRLTNYGFGPWLYKICHNEVIDAYRQLGRYKQKFSFSSELEANIYQNAKDEELKSIELELTDAEQEKKILTEVAKLPESEKKLLLQKFYRDQSYQELSEETGESNATIRKKVSRIIQKLRLKVRNDY